jgi:hypothetical protein
MFPWAEAAHALHHVRDIILTQQPAGALCAAVASAEAGTRVVVQGCYRGGFTIHKPGVCVQGQGSATINGDGLKNAVCVSAANCRLAGLSISHALHHGLHVTGDGCVVSCCTVTRAARAAVGVFGAGSVAMQGCWFGQHCASGIYATDRARVTLSDSAISSCAGAGVHCSGSSTLTAENTCVVLTRKAGVFCEKQSHVHLTECTLLRNAYGCLHAVDAACVRMNSCRLAHSRRGGVWSSGSGVRVHLVGCRIAFNKMSCVTASGGATAHMLRCWLQHQHRSAVFCDAASAASVVCPPPPPPSVQLQQYHVCAVQPRAPCHCNTAQQHRLLHITLCVHRSPARSSALAARLHSRGRWQFQATTRSRWCWTRGRMPQRVLFEATGAAHTCLRGPCAEALWCAAAACRSCSSRHEAPHTLFTTSARSCITCDKTEPPATRCFGSGCHMRRPTMSLARSAAGGRCRCSKWARARCRHSTPSP